MASVEKRIRAGKTTYRVRYRDPAGRQRSKVFTRKADADGWLTDNDYAKDSGQNYSGDVVSRYGGG